MDSRVRQEDINETLRKFDRKKDSDRRERTGIDALAVASAIGTETPMTLLADIRRCICELTDTVRKSNEETRLREENSVQRHSEVLAFMSEMNETLRKHQTGMYTPTSARTPTSTGGKQEQREYFYGGDKLSTKNAVVGCALMQIYNVAVRQISGSGYHQIDATPMELKHWSTLVAIVVEADSNVTRTKGKPVLPKQTSLESVTASELIASTVEGRNTSCKLEHLHRLQDECPSIAAAVSEIVERITACPGLISPSRFKCLASMSFPFIARDGTLNISSVTEQKGVTKVILDTVSKLNVIQKKQYAVRVLRDNVRPLVAAKEIERAKANADVV